ncbi:FemAB family PEP-CTERM system-associated protein [Psychrosphaera sp. 1_MG-2023]|uniref:FemAB family PEP-CTERM system-associated protein n=1 Tax=Psychrosphaera algicola TaxID=3023714 RepID=A0ABT5FG82_9GAMM|nr:MULTISPECIES: FemAB family XrtA/PEP-CTERM system-associated protein [unclassified Psychrosphaera]MDC2890012.1 FemAB family PEP-CTERM system-associated protein [Psychrosphaera sp. G1-22]MDO6720384.1 FemAB family PEP-CTERM system-associated protein [Psychrosphaera sp. 1_MG-2023]
MTILVKTYNSAIDAEWDEYVKSHDNGSIYHLMSWKPLIEKCFGHKASYLYAINESGKICGVLPAVNVKSALFGNNLISMPYFNYGGAIADSTEIAQKLTQATIEFAKQQGIDYVQFRENQADPDSTLEVSTSKVNMILQLPETAELLGKSIGSKRRSQIKRPIREGVSHKFGGLELLDDFYEVFCLNMRDLGTPVYAKSFFQEILTTFASNAILCVIYWEGKPVSTGFLLHHNNRMEIPWASTVRYANRISVNMYLYWQILSYAIEQEFKEFDFGRSTIDAGTYKFKKQWGAEPSQCYWYHWVPDGKTLPNLSPTNSKFELAIKIWQKLPLGITKLIGPPIVKNLP